MLGLRIDAGAGAAPSVLLLGAHSDDIEIGCGGTVLRLLASRPDWRVTWVVLGADGGRAEEARRSASLFLEHAAEAEVLVRPFRDGFFPDQWAAIKEFFEELKARVRPDLIFTHHGADRHQDHRVVSELTWNTFRDHFVLEYEIPKYDGGLVSPNVFVALDEATRRTKIEYLLEAFATQRDKRWFTEATFDGLMRLRGIECAAPEGYAEGFHVRKATLTL